MSSITDPSPSPQKNPSPTTTKPNINILLFGTGSVGSTYAFLLTRSGLCSVTCIARGNYDAINRDGIFIDSELWGQHHFRPAHVAKSVEEAVEELRTRHPSSKLQGGGTGHDANSHGNDNDNNTTSHTPPPPPPIFNYILITSKATVPSSAPLLAPAISTSPPFTTLILCQNGISTESPYASLYPHNPLLTSVVYLPVTQTTPGHIRHSSQELLEIGTFPAHNPLAPHAKQRAKDFAALFEKGGGTVRVYEDVQEARWRKLLINASWNPVCALVMLDDAGFLSSSEGAVRLIRDVMREVAAIAQALGYTGVNDEVVETQLARAVERQKSGRGIEPSMLADVKRGVGMEVEAVVGNAVRVAREKGVEVKVLEVVYALIKGRDTALRIEGSGV